MNQRSSPQARDAAVRLVSRMNRWLLAGSVALTGMFWEVAAHAFPGKTANTTATRSGASSSRHHQSTTTSASPLQPAAKPPQSAPAEETAPPQESTTTQQPVPTQESAPVQEPAPAEESTPAPVVSGGS
ncbi:MAG: hypothetical protein ACRDK2_01230 [Solirubrobacteraceae bacterium]